MQHLEKRSRVPQSVRAQGVDKSTGERGQWDIPGRAKPREAGTERPAPERQAAKRARFLPLIMWLPRM